MDWTPHTPTTPALHDVDGRCLISHEFTALLAALRQELNLNVWLSLGRRYLRLWRRAHARLRLGPWACV